MKLSGKAKSKARLEARQKAYDRESSQNKAATKRPGSRNPRKGK